MKSYIFGMGDRKHTVHVSTTKGRTVATTGHHRVVVGPVVGEAGAISRILDLLAKDYWHSHPKAYLQNKHRIPQRLEPIFPDSSPNLIKA